MILYDSGWRPTKGVWILSIEGPKNFSTWVDWMFCWVSSGRKRSYRILGIDVERELPHSGTT